MLLKRLRGYPDQNAYIRLRNTCTPVCTYGEP
jgi:hypothetical protein